VTVTGAAPLSAITWAQVTTLRPVTTKPAHDLAPALDPGVPARAVHAPSVAARSVADQLSFTTRWPSAVPLAITAPASADLFTPNSISAPSA
jgi:hypothetical protein